MRLCTRYVTARSPTFIDPKLGVISTISLWPKAIYLMANTLHLKLIIRGREDFCKHGVNQNTSLMKGFFAARNVSSFCTEIMVLVFEKKKDLRIGSWKLWSLRHCQHLRLPTLVSFINQPNRATSKAQQHWIFNQCYVASNINPFFVPSTLYWSRTGTTLISTSSFQPCRTKWTWFISVGGKIPIKVEH